MAKTTKIWKAMIYALVVSIVLNGAYFYLNVGAPPTDSIMSIVAISSSVISAVNYIIMGFVSGLGFYLAKSLTEKN